MRSTAEHLYNYITNTKHTYNITPGCPENQLGSYGRIFTDLATS